MDKLLKNSLVSILSEPYNVVVTTGSVSGNSIEVEFIKEGMFESYLYQGDTMKRDQDIKKLVKLLKEKV
jgi:hypothetical protein